MSKILLAEVNISEGIDSNKIEKITQALKNSADIAVIDQNSDKDHNRTVYTYIGEPQAVLQASKNLSLCALEQIDMRQHQGSHPRMGALDVVPFVPVRHVSQEEALAIAHAYGRFLGEQGVPVFYYEEAATRPERKLLVDIRKGQYEALADKMRDEFWRPDEGPFEFVAKSGATVTGVRFPLVAFNVNLHTEDLQIGQAIAKRMRFSSGGLRYVRAIALTLTEKKQIQVSMNLTNYQQTPIAMVYELIKSLAAQYGVLIAETELVGPVPLQALEEVIQHCLQVRQFSIEQIIETSLLSD